MTRKTLAALAAIMTIATAPFAQAESLSDALASSYKNSGLLEQNRALLRAADESVAQAMASVLPVINWSITSTRTRANTDFGENFTNTTAARMTGSLTLYDGGGNRSAIEAQKEVVLATRQALRDIEQSVLLRTVQAYMNLVRAQEFVQLRQNNVRVITQEFRAAQDRFEVGEVTRTDVALAEARLAAARSLLAAAQGDLAVASEEYNAAVGNAPSRLSGVQAAPVSRNLIDAQEFAMRNHPSILEAQHNVAAAELNIARAQASMRPQLSLDGFVSRDTEANTTVQSGLTLSGPISSGGALTSQIRQAQANRDAARSGLHLTRVSIEQQVANAYAQLQVARATNQASEQQIRAARIAFQGVREEATLGSRTTLDVLDAEQELLDAQANRISAQSDVVIASYAVLSAMGLLTVDHLNLPVQQYDPSEYYNLATSSTSTRSEQGAAIDRVLEALGKD